MLFLEGICQGGNAGWVLSGRKYCLGTVQEGTLEFLSGREHQLGFVRHSCRYVDLVDICRVGKSGFFQ